MSEETITSREADRAAGSSRGTSASQVGAFSGREMLRRVFSFPAMLGALLVGAVFCYTRAFMVDPDVWWHIKVGQTILATHHWPTTDTFSFTAAGQPWYSSEWLGEVLLAAVWRVRGVRGLELLFFILGCASTLPVYLLATIRSKNSKAGFVAAAILLILANTEFSLRPQMLGYLFLTVELIALELFRQGKKGFLWVLPPLFVLWINTHGSWIVGLGVIAVYWACGLKEFRLGGIEALPWSASERRSLSLALLASIAAVTITPYGTELAVFPFQFAFGLPISARGIEEWLPMPFGAPVGKIFLAVVLGFFLAQFALRLTWRLEEVLFLFGGTAMACLHARFLVVFVPFLAPLLAVVFSQWIAPYAREKDKFMVNAVLMACIAAAVAHYFPSRAWLDGKVAERFPVKAVEYMNEHPVTGRMFDSYGFGGYLVLSGRKVFIDGRAELYEPAGVFTDYAHLTELTPGGLDVLQRYQIESCLLRSNEPLVGVLGKLPGWQRMYSDGTSVLFVRREDAAR